MRINEECIKDIFNDIKENNNDAFKMLYDQYYRTIYGIAFSICKNKETSEDAVQNVLLKLYTLPNDKFPASNELSWLYTVTKNETLGLLRKEKYTEDIDKMIIPVTKSDIDDFIDMQRYYSIISDLNEKQQKIVTLKVLGDMKHREIAQVLNMKVGTVQWIYNTSIIKLRTKIISSSISSFIFGYLFTRNLLLDLNIIKSSNDNDFNIQIQENVTIDIYTIFLGFMFICCLCSFISLLKKANKKNS